MTRRPRALAAAASILALAFATSASAAGFYIQEQSVRGLGRAYSGEAADTGAQSIWWNPAAIGEVEGVEIYGGLNGVFSGSQVDDSGSTIQRPGQPTAPVGGASSAHNPLETGAVPSFDAAWRVSNHLALGLAVSAPFDFTTKYAADSFTRYQAITSKLQDFDLQPTLAIHVNRYLDLGVGFDAQYAKATLSQDLPNLSPLLPDGFESLKGDGWNYGWNIGAQVHPTSALSLGASYRSSIGHTLNGTVAVSGLLGPLAAENSTLAGTANFATPWIVVVGGRYRIDPRLTLDAQVQRVGWSEFKTINVTTLAGVTAIPQNYHDTTTGAVGLDYDVTHAWTMRAGVAYDPTPTPDDGRSARVPDGNRWMFSLGTTVRPARNIAIDGALSYVHLQRSPLDSDATAYAGTPVATPISYEGEVSGHAVIVSSGVTFKF
jgi:long-chain fatty acid transport protein